MAGPGTSEAPECSRWSVDTSDYLMKYGKFAFFPEATASFLFRGASRAEQKLRCLPKDGGAALTQGRCWLIQQTPKNKIQSLRPAEMFHLNRNPNIHCIYKTEPLKSCGGKRSAGKRKCDRGGEFLVLLSPKATSCKLLKPLNRSPQRAPTPGSVSAVKGV